METTNGMLAISQVMNEMNQATMGKTDWNEGWDKEAGTESGVGSNSRWSWIH